jgi:predicted SAM-dependent methyltransferase
MKRSNSIFLYDLRRWKYHWQVRIRYRKYVQQSNSPLKVVLGSGTTDLENWVSTDYPFFDILKAKQWNFLFRSKSPQFLLAEHVLEHLTEKDVGIALSNAYKYLGPDGNFRIAVPDKNHPNTDYIEYVRPGGNGPGCDDHKSFWEIDSLSELAESIGYEVTPLECYNKEGVFYQSQQYDNKKGYIFRSRLNGVSNLISDYSSLIVDLRKQ